MKRILALILVLAAVTAADITLLTPEDGSLFLPQGGPMIVCFSWTGGHPQEVHILVIWDEEGPVYVCASYPPHPFAQGQWVLITAFGEGFYDWQVWAGVEHSDVWSFEIRGNCPPCRIEPATWGRVKALF